MQLVVYAPQRILEAPKDYLMLVFPQTFFGASTKPPSGSIQRFIKTNHTQLGGLTNGSQTMQFWSSRALIWVATEPSTALLIISLGLLHKHASLVPPK